MGRGSNFKASAIAIATVAIGSAELSAQGTNPNSAVNANVGLTTRVSVDTNEDLAATSAGTTVSVSELISFDVTSETSLQRLSFSANGALSFTSTDGETESAIFDNPGFRLSYGREGADSSLNLSANYRSSEVIHALDAEDATVEDLTTDTGNLQAYGANVGYNFGTNSPFGLSLTASQNFREYTDTTDPDLVDSETTRFGATASLRFSPVTQGTFGVSRSDTTIENAAATERVSTSYDLGLSHQLRRGLDLGFSLGFSETETTEAAVASTADTTSTGIRLTQELPDGSIFGSINLRQSDTQDTTSLTFGRSMELPDGSLSASLTASNGSVDGTRYLGNLNFTKDLPRGSFNVGLSQSIATNLDDEDVIFSRLGVGFNQSINSVSGINLSMNLTRTEDAGGGSIAEKTRADFTASYTQELADDWNMSLGYSHRSFAESGADTAESDSVFLTLSKSIALGF